MIPSKQDIKKNPWQFFNTFFRRKLTIIQIGANLVGAGIVTFYFLFFDQGLTVPDAINDLIVIGIMFVGLVIIATVFLSRWQKDLIRFVDLKMHDQAADSDLRKKVQRKILNLPCMCALTSLFNWFLAANIMTIYFSSNLIEGSFAVKYFEGIRVFIGVILAGNVTCAIIFFSVEKSCARIWPHFFPDGGLIKTRAVFRLRLHVRMLVIFGLASVMPIILMAVLSYNKARMMLVLPPPGCHWKPFVFNGFFAGGGAGHRYLSIRHIFKQHHCACQIISAATGIANRKYCPNYV